MFYKLSLFFSILINTVGLVSGQTQDQYKILTIGYYNLENLFDTEDDPTINDEEFTPEGTKAWTSEKYSEKIANMAYVISQIGIDKNPLGLSILGVEEVENIKVLQDLVASKPLVDRDYKIIHYDSPDRRGIDVALIYNPKHFKPIHHDTIPVKLYRGDGSRRFTRNILYVKGMLDSDTIHYLVNHWPSRSGGEKRSAPSRKKAASLCKKYADSVLAINPAAKIIIGGDLNDDPNSPSIKYNLQAKARKREVQSTDLFNPMADFYRRGIGSNAYRDSWSLFDQIIISGAWVNKKQEGYSFYQSYVFNKKMLIQPNGKYKGYPFRTFSGDRYQGGYSDHFPVYAHFVKRVK